MGAFSRQTSACEVRGGRSGETVLVSRSFVFYGKAFNEIIVLNYEETIQQ